MTNTPGVSLIAIAKPTSAPGGSARSSRGRGRRRSIKHASTMKALTCPNRIPSPTGCSQNIGAASSPNTIGRARPGRPSLGRAWMRR